MDFSYWPAGTKWSARPVGPQPVGESCLSEASNFGLLVKFFDLLTRRLQLWRHDLSNLEAWSRQYRKLWHCSLMAWELHILGQSRVNLSYSVSCRDTDCSLSFGCVWLYELAVAFSEFVQGGS